MSEMGAGGSLLGLEVVPRSSAISMYSPHMILTASLCGTGRNPSLRTKGLRASPFTPFSVPLSTEEGAGDHLSLPSAGRLSVVLSPGRSHSANLSSASSNRNLHRCSDGGMSSKPALKGGEVRDHHHVCLNQAPPGGATPNDLPTSKWPPNQNSSPRSWPSTGAETDQAHQPTSYK